MTSPRDFSEDTANRRCIACAGGTRDAVFPALGTASHATLYRGTVSPTPQELLRPECIGTRDFPRCFVPFRRGARCFLDIRHRLGLPRRSQITRGLARSGATRPYPQTLLRPELIGTVRSNRMTKSLGQGDVRVSGYRLPRILSSRTAATEARWCPCGNACLRT